jgi:hypothetical protein
MATEEDCCDAFGSDNGDEEEAEDTNIVQGQQDTLAVALLLSQFFLKQNSQVRLSDRGSRWAGRRVPIDPHAFEELRNDNCGGCIVFVGFGCYSCNGYHE